MTFINRREFVGMAGLAAVGLPMRASLAGISGKSPPRIRIGQIGVGHAHASKLSVYRASPDYEVVGIVEPNRQLRERAESQKAYRDLTWMTQDELLNVPGLQAVCVETNVRDLLDVAESCVAAGKHVHIDKPAGESLPHFERTLGTAQEQKLLVQMGYMYRYNPAIILLREFLQKGWLGDVFEVHTVMSKVVNPASRRALAEYPGGMMFELGCHILDLVIGVLGQPQQVTSVNQHVSSIDDDLLDNMLCVLKYPGATATVKSSAMEVDGFARRHFVVCGTEGTMHIQPLDNPSARVAFTVPHSEFKRGYQDVAFPRFARYVADAADMASIIRGEKQADFTYDHDLTVQRSLLQACGISLDDDGR
jgi:predicted dehydrogenase